MIRFIYVTDTHHGANPAEYHQQPAFPQRMKELVSLLDRWITTQPSHIDFVLHGGDIIDRCTPELIQESQTLWNMSVPVHLTLGNHDLTETDSVSSWLHNAPHFFPEKSPERSLLCSDCVLHIVPNHWEQVPYHWNDTQEPYFSPDQLRYLATNLERDPHKTHILSTHSPLFGIPTEQTGFDRIYHGVDPSFRASIIGLVDRFPQLKCILSGHNHMNSLTRHQGAIMVTASSFMEAPFEFKLIEIHGNAFSISTHDLISQVGFAANYDFNKTFVQGRQIDRQHSWTG